jgi:hypothetical protein
MSAIVSHVYGEFLSEKERSSEAIVWMADLIHAVPEGKISVEERNKYFEVCAEYSPFMEKFLPGVYVEKHPEFDGYRFMTSRPIEKGETIFVEKPSVPFSSSVLSYNTRDFLENFEEKHFPRMNGVFPRRYEDIPESLLKRSEGVVAVIKEVFPNATRTEIQEWRRKCVVVAANCHHEGIHQFIDFVNHSCEPNCYYGDIDRVSVVAQRDIAAGEELTCNYGSTKYGNLAQRRATFLRTWGSICFCTKCQREEKEEQHEKIFAEKDQGLWFFKDIFVN